MGVAPLRLALHVALALALALRSAQIGGALHPYERSLASEWVRLLFFVDTTAIVPASPFSGGQATEVPLTLPHFLMDVEEEVAANVDDEFFDGGFAARASALPVGVLFTINETRAHVHGAVANYFRLVDIALDSYVLFDNVSAIPAPELTVRRDVGEETIEQRYRILDPTTTGNWPKPLQADASVAETRKFFDELDAMQLKFVLGLRQKTPKHNEAGTVGDDGIVADEEEKMYVWRLSMRYDLQNQGHLEVAMAFDLKHMRVKPVLGNALSVKSIDEFYSNPEDDESVPSIVFDTSTTFDWGLLVLITAYQITEFILKKHNPTVGSSSESRPVFQHEARESKAAFIRRALIAEAKDFWFWFVLVLNVSTVACLLQTWHHAYRLSLNDTLCFVFATCVALHWVSLVRYLQVNERFTILGLTLQRGLPRVVQFLAGALPIFVGFVLFGTVMFGAKVPRFQTASATATTLFSVANGDEIHDTFNAVAYTPWIGQIYVYCYMILFSYVVLMVCIGIIEDAFFAAVFPATWPTSSGDSGGSSSTNTKSGSNEDRR